MQQSDSPVSTRPDVVAIGSVPSGIALQLCTMISMGFLALPWILRGANRRDRRAMAHAIDGVIWNEIALVAAMVLAVPVHVIVFIVRNVRDEPIPLAMIQSRLGTIVAISAFVLAQLVVTCLMVRAIRRASPFRFPVTFASLRDGLVVLIEHLWCGGPPRHVEPADQPDATSPTKRPDPATAPKPPAV